MLARLIILLLFFLKLAAAEQIAEIIEPQYNISLKHLSYNNEKQQHEFLLSINLNKDWKLLARSKGSKQILSNIELNNNIRIKNISYQWPQPIEIANGDLVYYNKLLIPIKVTSEKNVDLDWNINIAACNNDCILKSHDIHYHNSHSIFYMLIIGFIGGVILNFMPCVLPVLSIKLLTIINSANYSRYQIRKQFLASISGIIFTFWVLALIAHSLKSSGEYFGLGLNFQEPSFLIFLVFSLIFYAAALQDKFIINLPISFQNKLIFDHEKRNIIGSFIAGIFATLLATPCIAPFIGSAISYALSCSNSTIYLIFSAIGIGMALPYILLFINTKLLAILPKPGKWMVTTKIFLSILIYATVVWLIYIIHNLLDNKSAIILFMLCLLLKFTLENRLTFKKKIVALFVIIFAGFTIPNLAFKQDISHKQEVNQIWQPFSYAKLAHYIEAGNIVIVDVSADWCLTCKLNKFLVLDNEFMFSYYQKHNIVTLRADYTAKNPEAQKLLIEHKHPGIPLDIIYSNKTPHGQILPSILKTSDVINAIQKSK